MSHLPAAALFDLDGVLVDTETIYTRIWDEIESVFPTGIPNFAMSIKGCTLPDILSRYFPQPEVSQKVCQMLKEREEAMDYPVFEGVMNFLEELHQAHVPSAIVTSSGDAKMGRLAKREPRFYAMFDAVITDSCVTHSKPHPEPYLTGAKMLGVDAHDCIVFEDSLSGMAAGRAAGAVVVGLATTNPRETIQGKADVLVDNFRGLHLADLLDMIKESGREF